jgi:copper transport protein
VVRALVVVAALAILGASAVALPVPVAAHALLVSSDPSAGATLAGAPPFVTLTFGERPDPRLSTIKVLDVEGRDQTAGPSEAVDSEPTMLRVQLKPVGDGVYTVSWRTVSAVDGHAAAGSFAFGVGVAPGTSSSPPTTTTAPNASPAATLIRWLLYLGLAGLLGAGVVGFVVTGPMRRLAWLALLSWLLTVAGTAGVIATQWIDAGADPATLVGSSIGAAAAARIAVTVGTALAVALVISRAARRWPFALLAAATAGALLVDVFAGHAAADSPLGGQVAVQWLHGLAAGIWIGGLAALLLSVRDQAGDETARAVRRFSGIAGGALIAVVATGVVRAVDEVGSIQALVGTDFGRVVIVKSALLVALVLFGARNRFRNVALAGRTLRGLRLAGSAEVAIGVAILLATGLLVNLPPPSSSANAAPAATPSLVTHGHDFGTSVRVRLVVTPGTAGFNDFTAAVTDYDSGAPVSAPNMWLRFAIASTTGVGESTLTLPPSGQGTFATSGGNLSLDGIWRITASVAGPSGPVEVPLVLSTAVTGQHVHPTTGPPTIYTVLLANGESVQVYLDPEKTGKNQLHMTFFDKSGAELPVPTATAAVAPRGGDAMIVVPRLLEPGHFVADIDAPAGQLGVDVVATQGSEQLHAHVDVEVAP